MCPRRDPGLMDTPRLHTADGAERETIVQNQAAVLPQRRVGTADEVAQVILLLMTNDYLTWEQYSGARGPGRSFRVARLDRFRLSIGGSYVAQSHPVCPLSRQS
jgi:hypothetical protein